MIVVIESGHKFAHVMAAQLPWHVQNCGLLWSVFFVKNDMNVHKIWIVGSSTFCEIAPRKQTLVDSSVWAFRPITLLAAMCPPGASGSSTIKIDWSQDWHLYHLHMGHNLWHEHVGGTIKWSTVNSLVTGNHWHCYQVCVSIVAADEMVLSGLMILIPYLSHHF